MFLSSWSSTNKKSKPKYYKERSEPLGKDNLTYLLDVSSIELEDQPVNRQSPMIYDYLPITKYQ